MKIYLVIDASRFNRVGMETTFHGLSKPAHMHKRKYIGRAAKGYKKAPDHTLGPVV